MFEEGDYAIAILVSSVIVIVISVVIVGYLAIRKKLSIVKGIIIAGAIFVLLSILNLIGFMSPPKNVVVEIPEGMDMESAIVTYLEAKGTRSYSGEGKLFCIADVRWQYQLSQTEYAVYAYNSCAEVFLIEGDLRGGGGGSESPWFKLEKKDDKWKVVDVDNRTVNPEKEPITQDWIEKVNKKVPKELTKPYIENYFSTKGVIEKAAEYYKVSLPNYLLNACKSNSDCENGFVCVLHGDHSNPGPSTCVKKCNANKDCGIAHTCRGQCVNGENGCPETFVNICIPDTLSKDVEKDPDGIIK